MQAAFDVDDYWHVPVLGSLLLAYFFGAAGGTESLFDLIYLPEFYMLLGLNFIEVFFIWILIRNLARKEYSWYRGIGLPYFLMLLFEGILIILGIMDFDPIDFYTILLPFSFICILAINIYYRFSFSKKTHTPAVAETARKTSTILLDTSKGKTRLQEEEIGIVYLAQHKTQIHLKNGDTLNAWCSLRNIFSRLQDPTQFYMLNRKAFVNIHVIQHYETLPDSRLLVHCHTQSFTVSKNKAAHFKQWFNISHEAV